MRNKLLILLALVAAVLLASGNACARKAWTNTQPAINATHIFQGEINRRGKPTGFHAKFNGKVAKGAKILRIKGKPNKAGVYTANVAILDPESKQWKNKFSSMFPDKMKPKEVLKAVLHAYKHRKKGKTTPWRGPSGYGFPIEGYLLRNGKINTAYPIYIRDKR
ncbi:MAG TPA: hypothetical protein ENJ84_14650 [Gammaproteobacteria bacterium]|nr:hypothetical protein [Gammaproteobacteria bacterium]